MKTSARNVFQGRIVALRQSGLLVEAILSTAGGLRVAALITDESYRSLALEEGKLVNASVKAPCVMIEAGAPEGGNGRVDATSGAENRFAAVVERVREDGMVMEILAALPEGSQICALQSKGPATGAPLRAGDKITVLFKAFSVILSLD